MWPLALQQRCHKMCCIEVVCQNARSWAGKGNGTKPKPTGPLQRSGPDPQPLINFHLAELNVNELRGFIGVTAGVLGWKRKCCVLRNLLKGFWCGGGGSKRSQGITTKGRSVLSWSVTYPTLFSFSADTILHSAVHSSFLSPSENCLGYRNCRLRPLCVFWLWASYLPIKLTDPRLQPKLFSTYSPFQGGERTALQGLRRRGLGGGGVYNPNTCKSL